MAVPALPLHVATSVVRDACGHATAAAGGPSAWLPARNRAAIVEWIIIVCGRVEEWTRATLHLAVKLLDTFSQRVAAVPPRLWQYCAAAAQWIASKFEERTAYAASVFTTMSRDKLKTSVLLNMEVRMFLAAHSVLAQPTAHAVLESLLVLHPCTQKLVPPLARLMNDAMLVHCSAATTSAVTRAAVALCLARVSMLVAPVWPGALTRITGLASRDVLHTLVAWAHRAVHDSVREGKYAQGLHVWAVQCDETGTAVLPCASLRRLRRVLQ
jgi:hypothetical protein